MRGVNFKYSMKSTPTASKFIYLKNLIFKPHFFEKSNEIGETSIVNNFGFRSVLTPKNEHLIVFEE